MANKYTRKGQVPKAPDEFVSFWSRAYDAILPHWNSVLIGLGVAVILIAGAWIGTSLWTSSREEATELFGKAVRIYDAELVPADVKPEELKDDDDTPRFKTAKERGEAAIAAAEKLEKSHGRSAIAHEATLFKGGVLFDLGRYDEAQAAYRKFLEKAAKDDPMRPIALEGDGLCLEARGKLDEALATFKELSTLDGQLWKDRGLYDQARILGRRGDTAGAEKILKDLLARNTSGALHDDVQNRLALLGAGAK